MAARGSPAQHCTDLALSREARWAWIRAAVARKKWLTREDDEDGCDLQQEESEYLAAGKAAYTKLRFEVAALDLIAARATRDAAAALAGEHLTAEVFAKEGVYGKELSEVTAQVNALMALEQALLNKFRADLGLPRERTRHHLRSVRESVARLDRRPPAG